MSGHAATRSASIATEVLGNPQWFPEKYDRRTGNFHFVKADSDELSSQPFLDDRWNRAGAEHRVVNAVTLAADYSPASAPLGPNFIWHTGFCCSTLLARALNAPGRSLSLCEPRVLFDVSDAKRAHVLGNDPVSARIPELGLYLLGRSPGKSCRVAIKPAPAANNLIPEAAKLTCGKMLFLYSDCRSFLLSIARGGEDTRKYVRRMFLMLAGDGPLPAAWSQTDLLTFSDLEMAAIVWHLQIGIFLREWHTVEPSRMASLDCDAFLDDPLATLIKLSAFFGVDLAELHLRTVVEGPLFGQDAKRNGEAFDARKRRDGHEKLRNELASHLDQIISWSFNLFPSTPRGAPFPAPVLSIDKAYT